MMDWNQLLSVKRTGKHTTTISNEELRTEFQRDYDRMIFSSPFRRLQNKTQVFPLPGSVFVHNRLTHSLEVASVGRSLGNMISLKLEKKGVNHPLVSEIGSVVAAACLAHDLGNPPFGHSGEDAIKEFFSNGKGKEYIASLSKAQQADFTSFDGNANSLRMLDHQFQGRREGGFSLTYTMLSAIVKYPYESTARGGKDKFGFFQSEKDDYAAIARELGIPELTNDPLKFVRHPLVYLVEAADDICYQIMDIEDAHKLKILSFEETKNLYLNFYHPEEDKSTLDRIHSTLIQVTDPNEQIAYLRAGVINLLVKECINAFDNNYEAIMEGKFQGSLIKSIAPVASSAMKKVIEISINLIYCHQSVVEIELAGYKIISTLLEHFTVAVLHPTNYSKKLLRILPTQFTPTKEGDYYRIQSVVDFITGMTDVFALDLYRKITGIGLPAI
jgi:dGTPase